MFPPVRNMYKSGPTAKVFKSYKQIKKIASLLNDILRNNVLGQRCLQKIKLVSMVPTF